MVYFNFHHHNPIIRAGIYNLNGYEDTFHNYFSCGIHPKDINVCWQEDLEVIRKKTLDKNCLAIGECGLDGTIKIPEHIQEEVFSAHIHWANEIEKPLIIHCVRRFQETVRVCKPLKPAAVIHGFNKKKPLAEELLSHGFYLSFGAALLRSLSLQEIFKSVPAEKFFLETDGSESDIAEIYWKAAEIKNIRPEEIQAQVNENLKKIVNEC